MAITELNAALVEVMKAIATALEDEHYSIGMDKLVKNDRSALRASIARFEQAAAK